MSYVDDVYDFMSTGEQHIASGIYVDNYEMLELSICLIEEEVKETLDALMQTYVDPVELADGLVDLVYVAIGAALRHGIDFDACWREVHRSNMAKFPGGKVIRKNGKIMKPEGWTPPNLAPIVAGGM